MVHEDLRLRELASSRMQYVDGDAAVLPDGNVPLEGLAERLDEADWNALLEELLEPAAGTGDLPGPIAERLGFAKGGRS
jgi:hypothetical protein